MKRVLAAAFCMMILLAGCASPAPPEGSPSPQPPAGTPSPVSEEFAAYKALAAACNDDIYQLTIVLSNMGNFEHYTWSTVPAGETVDFEELLNTSYEWITENANETKESIHTKHQHICEQFETLQTITLTDPGFHNIAKNITALFESYDTFF
ncbi:MAG: hypothetical protein LBR76_08185, partial [Oscillospiraceae bacterium]|nr:hypothetical protein [Oscillospiraceae bacterium]